MSCENHIQVGSKLQRRACGSCEEERYRPMGRRAALLLVLVLLAPIPAEPAKKKNKGRTNMAMDRQMKELREECEEKIERAGVRDSCNVSPIARENCVLRCSSSGCYDEVYGSDSLEEGEVDTLRNRRFRTCFKEQLRIKKTPNHS